VLAKENNMEKRKMKKHIYTVLIAGLLLLSSIQLQVVIAANEEELFEQEIENYLPPYLLIDLTVNVTTSSVLGGVTLIGEDLKENGWAVTDIKLSALKGKAFVTPIRYLDKGEQGIEVQSLDTFEVKASYPTPLEHEVVKIAQTAIQSEVAEIGYEDRDSDAMTARDVLEEYDLVKTQNELPYEITNFAADELKPKESKIDYGTESSDTDKLAFHIFTATKDLNETSYIWTADALGLDNTTQITEMNVTTSEIEYKFPYEYREQLTDGITDGIYNLNFRKALTSLEDTAYNFFDDFKREQSSTQSKKPKEIRFNIAGVALVGQGFKDIAIRIGNGFEVPISTLVIIGGVLVVVFALLAILIYFTRIKPGRDENKMINNAQRQARINSIIKQQR
jgi:hypothetical protein